MQQAVDAADIEFFADAERGRCKALKLAAGQFRPLGPGFVGGVVDGDRFDDLSVFLETAKNVDFALDRGNGEGTPLERRSGNFLPSAAFT